MHSTILMEVVHLTIRNFHKPFSQNQVKLREELPHLDQLLPEVLETQRLLPNNSKLNSPPEELEV